MIEYDLKIVFQEKIQISYEDFKRKMSQNEMFQLQEKLSEIIIKRISENADLRNRFDELIVYENNAKALAETGKTYKNVLEEKIFTDGFRIFEEFLSNIFYAIFHVFPALLLNKENKLQEVNIPFEYLFNNNDIKKTQIYVIENRVKSYLQGDNIIKVLERFKITFNLTTNISDEKKITLPTSIIA